MYSYVSLDWRHIILTVHTSVDCAVVDKQSTLGRDPFTYVINVDEEEEKAYRVEPCGTSDVTVDTMPTLDLCTVSEEGIYHVRSGMV